MINTHTKFHFNMCIHAVQRKWTETANYWNFSKSKGHNSFKNGSIVPKRELDLDILMINPHTKFHFNMCIQCKENERKQMMDRQTAAKQYALPSLKGGGHKYHNNQKVLKILSRQNIPISSLNNLDL